MENVTLQKIDDILKRTNADYGTAKKALEESDGDVLEAIILIENMKKEGCNCHGQKHGHGKHNGHGRGHGHDHTNGCSCDDECDGENTFKEKSDQIIEQIKSLISKGNATKITIKRDGETVINLPITAGLIGTYFAPWLSALGLTAALLSQCSVEITQSDGKVINVGEKFEKGMNNVKDTVKDATENFQDVKDKAKDEFDKAKCNFEKAKDDFDDVKDDLKCNFEKAKDDFDDVKDDLKCNFEKAKDDMKSNFDEVKDKVKSNVDDMKDTVRSGADDLKDNIKSGADDLKDNIKSGVEDIKDKF